MTTFAKEQLKTDWQKARKVSSQRASRLSEILKSAGSEAFTELKGGSSEIGGLSRSALANLITYLKTQDLSGEAATTPQDTALEYDRVLAGAENSAETAEQDLPSWRQLLVELVGVVRDRKSDWLRFFNQQFNRYSQKVDSDLTEEYGDRYQRVKEQVQKVRARYGAAATASTPAETAATPVQVEVLED
jgi:hypothetical protein